MGTRIVGPSDIERICDQPGRLWDSESKQRVVEWLYADGQLGYLVHLALRHLGYGAQPEDAEDAWAAFCVLTLDAVINSYDPTKGRRFWNYLLTCFVRFCWDEGKKRRKRDDLTVSLDATIETDEGEPIDIQCVDDDPNSNPEQVAMRKGFRKVLGECLGALSDKQRKVFELREMEEMSTEETAQRLGLSLSDVKVSLHRANLQLKSCLSRKGWTP